MIIGIDASRANAREKTGTEWYSWHLIRALAPKLRDHTLRLYVREPLEAGLQNLGANVDVRVLSWSIGFLWSHLRLSWELFWHRPDLLFIPADTVPLWHPKRTITTIHDVAFERWPELYRGKSVQRRMGWLRPFVHLAVRIFTLGRYSASERDYHQWSARHALRSSQIILTVSEFSKQEIVATLKADPTKIVVTHLGVRQPDELTMVTPTTIANVQAAASVTKPYFLFIGRLEEKKNIGLLVQSYVAYRRRTPEPIDLVLLGAPGFGWDGVAKKIPDEDRAAIHQLGWVDEADRWSWQAGARGFLFLSAYEGFGLPPLESLSVGVPVLASRAGSLPEVLGDAAMFTNSHQPEEIASLMIRLATDEQLRADLIVRGRAWVGRYTWKATADATMTACSRIVPGLVRQG